MTPAELADRYRGYLACLNRQGWDDLGDFVGEDVEYNGERVGLAGYRKMLERDFDQIPDLHFHVDLLVAQPPFIASRLVFHCTPRSTFLGLPVNGRKVSFTENVFYRFEAKTIRQVWSVIDKAAIETQL